MRAEESFLSQPIRSLQTMLRVIAEQDPRHKTLIPDGIYGPETVSAVAIFQQMHGLPVTGVTDKDTWDSIYATYAPALILVAEAEPLHIILNPNEVIRQGQRHPNVYLVQGILLALADVYSSIPRPSTTGVLDDQTADALAAFQGLNGLPMTGSLDKRTWKHLALHYPLAANLGP